MQQKSIAPAALRVSALGISGLSNADSKLDTTFYGIFSLNDLNASTRKSMSTSYIDSGAQSSSRLGLKGSHEISPDLNTPTAAASSARTSLIGVGVQYVF